ncbi:TIGR01212 family radical SAM protein [Enterococcus faecalis]|uniref:TIGR01212 family radical SAM protein n=1 Tax=Enterococcus faecalis TaxID=1351 RepID=UPI00032EEB14|nr:TIGR01212 family radical SAM protein [Enterococcus faecalis]EOL35874.1 radical SAM superfamily protein [Enterococcus faecalis ATCC 19433 = NBRC 100480]MBA4555027.1 TIGR01212 family radical SAM protein [Enterococcus faecalis]RXF30723.1 TIGR01212 family radical SAM protein [Enterococcus faecalis]UON29783.1 TIGR01212 family radical SAM protein [Enterococcus faecalis]WMU07130.1 TIGR01212 family radical SAM protein [Enterococcus faecalis]
MQIFPYSDDPNKRYHTWNYALRQQFGEKIFKVPIDGGFDCPNLDGTVAKGGCTFCSVSGSGDMIVAPSDPLPLQFQKEIQLMHQKWPTVDQYIVYFQNFTNTHAPVDVIRHRFEQVVNEKGVVGLSIGTRPDCLPDEVVNYLAELNERFYLWVELGLQTTFEETSAAINRAHDYQTYLDGVAKLRKHGIRVCTHLINGLPGETPAMMRENVRRTIQDSDIQGIKLHLLHLMTNTKMMRDYNEGRLQLMSKEAYVSVICDQLEMIPPEIVIHRLTGDAPFETIIGPMWSLKKWEVLNAIDAEMKRRNSYQGKYTVISGKEVFN